MTDTSYDYDARKERDAQLASEEQMTNQPKPIERLWQGSAVAIVGIAELDTLERQLAEATAEGTAGHIAHLERQLAACTDECNRNGEALVESIRENAAMREAGGLLESLLRVAWLFKGYGDGPLKSNNEAIRLALNDWRKAAGG